MTASGWIQILAFFGAIWLVTAPTGAFLHRVLEGREHFLKRPLGWLERLVYRLCGVDGREQRWEVYAGGLLAFSAFTMIVTYAIQRLQHLLPEGLAGTRGVMQFLSSLSRDTYVNVMDQYHPCYRANEDGRLRRGLTPAEHEAAVAMARAAGLHRFA